MTLEEIRYFTEQFQELRSELKADIRDLKAHIDSTLGGHADKLDDHEARLNTVENNHWRMTAICSAIVFFTQLAINIALELFKR